MKFTHHTFSEAEETDIRNKVAADDVAKARDSRLKIRLLGEESMIHERLIGFYKLSAAKFNGKQSWIQVDNKPVKTEIEKPNFIWYDKKAKVWKIGQTLGKNDCSLHSTKDSIGPDEAKEWKYATREKKWKIATPFFDYVLSMY